jgi:hypothetical protein
MEFVELELTGKKVDCGVVITCVVKYKVANFISANTKRSQRCEDNLAILSPEWEPVN